MIKDEDIEALKSKFPHVAFKIRTLWGYPQMNDYFNELLSDGTRGGTRQGFPLEIALLLMNLLEKHQKDYPEYLSNDDGVWIKNRKIV
jgi:hypothetical protein